MSVALAQAYGRVLGKCFLMREVPLYLVRGVLVRARLKQHLDHGLVPVPRRDDERRVSLLPARWVFLMSEVPLCRNAESPSCPHNGCFL